MRGAETLKNICRGVPHPILLLSLTTAEQGESLFVRYLSIFASCHPLLTPAHHSLSTPSASVSANSRLSAVGTCHACPQRLGELVGAFFPVLSFDCFSGPDGNDLYDRRSALGNNDGSPVGLDIVHDGKAAVLEDADSYLLRGVLLTPMVIET
jgi:hypothetical protein